MEEDDGGTSLCGGQLLLTALLAGEVRSGTPGFESVFRSSYINR